LHFIVDDSVFAVLECWDFVMRKYRISNMNYLAVFFSEGSTVERGPGGSMS